MPTAEELKQLFDEFDADKSGYINVSELESALEKGGKTITHEAIEKMVDDMAKDKDGKVSFSEFETVFSLSPDELPSSLGPLVSMSSFLLRKVAYAPVAVVGAVAGAVMYPFQEKEFKDMNSNDIKNAIKRAKKEAARRRLAKLKNVTMAANAFSAAPLST